jgi:hypothetical protein
METVALMGAVSVQPSVYFLSLFREKISLKFGTAEYNYSMNYQWYSVFVPVTELSRGLTEMQVNLYRVTQRKKTHRENDFSG